MNGICLVGFGVVALGFVPLCILWAGRVQRQRRAQALLRNARESASAFWEASAAYRRQQGLGE